jgi:RNA polymerase sigma-70 factor (ECF subfamily)
MISESPSTPLLSQTEEDQLVAAVKQDTAAFAALYDRYLTPVYRYLFSRVGNHQEAEDLTSKVFLTALERFEQFRPDSSFAAWLFTIARNKSIDFFRQQHPEAELPDDRLAAPAEDDPAALAVREADRQAIFQIIGAFPPDDRELLNLRFAADLTYSEIAHLLGRGESAVKKQVYRLLERIEKKLEVSHD